MKLSKEQMMNQKIKTILGKQFAYSKLTKGFAIVEMTGEFTFSYALRFKTISALEEFLYNYEQIELMKNRKGDAK